jgi:hypothetical protein
MGEWIKVGVVGIDSATVFIGDPAHIRDAGLAEKRIDWNKLLGAKYPVLRQLGKHYGVLTSTGWGDGLYEVEARVVTKNHWPW